ncbi:MAG: DUF4760 domain-containing protein [Gemmatimonadaceae bacterium]
MLVKELPDHHDADLVLKLYDLRRELVMRESRSAINSKFWPSSFEELIALTKPDGPLNAPFRQTSTYWEMVYGMGRHGIVNVDFLIENNGEGLFLFARVLPYLDELREATNPRAFRNAEWISKENATGREMLQYFCARVAKTLESK